MRGKTYFFKLQVKFTIAAIGQSSKSDHEVEEADRTQLQQINFNSGDKLGIMMTKTVLSLVKMSTMFGL